MKSTKYNAQLQGMTAEELTKELTDAKKELFNLRFQSSTGQLENPMKMKEVKKDIARVKTVIRENELKAQA